MNPHEETDSFGKNESIARKHREAGIESYRSGQHFQALESFNKCLMFAKLDSTEMSLAYGNRSAVYMEVNDFVRCIDNIWLARATGYPDDRLDILDEREKRCSRLMEQEEKLDSPETFFKLSHPANKTVPFIVNCLELRQTARFGRCIFTNKG